MYRVRITGLPRIATLRYTVVAGSRTTHYRSSAYPMPYIQPFCRGSLVTYRSALPVVLLPHRCLPAYHYTRLPAGYLTVLLVCHTLPRLRSRLPLRCRGLRFWFTHVTFCHTRFRVLPPALPLVTLPRTRTLLPACVAGLYLPPGCRLGLLVGSTHRGSLRTGYYAARMRFTRCALYLLRATRTCGLLRGYGYTAAYTYLQVGSRCAVAVTPLHATRVTFACRCAHIVTRLVGSFRFTAHTFACGCRCGWLVPAVLPAARLRAIRGCGYLHTAGLPVVLRLHGLRLRCPVAAHVYCAVVVLRLPGLRCRLHTFCITVAARLRRCTCGCSPHTTVWFFPYTVHAVRRTVYRSAFFAIAPFWFTAALPAHVYYCTYHIYTLVHRHTLRTAVTVRPFCRTRYAHYAFCLVVRFYVVYTVAVHTQFLFRLVRTVYSHAFVLTDCRTPRLLQLRLPARAGYLRSPVIRICRAGLRLLRSFLPHGCVTFALDLPLHGYLAVIRY